MQLGRGRRAQGLCNVWIWGRRIANLFLAQIKSHISKCRARFLQLTRLLIWNRDVLGEYCSNRAEDVPQDL